MCGALTALGGRAPTRPAGIANLRRLLRGFFGPLLTPGPRAIAADEGAVARVTLKDKRALLDLSLPGRLLFLFRLRFGLYAVLARLGAVCDWPALESSRAAQRPEDAPTPPG